MVNKGASLHTIENYSDAIICYDSALKIDKKCAMALAYKGLSLGELGNLPDALKHFKKALSIDHDYDLANISKEMVQELLKSIKQQKAKTR
ncbi:tetratricopeptide repeat protein [Nitrosarchaeum sp. AC2]|uniref:tetratricopeptide repeat protein n=1 Tax=Nitrosarchaeum sp. AC2 TaxID=2259673 RepID=UPI0021059C14|nr:tetratricopeptide repeat protein [Nitrosarchaeum sp. AC2]